MVKRWTVVVALLSVALLAGCGKYADEPGQSTASGGNSGGSNSSGTGGGYGTSGGTSAGTSGGGGTSAGTGGGGGNTGATTGDTGGGQNAAAQKVKLEGLKVGDVAKVGGVQFHLKEIYLNTRAAGIPPGWAYLLLKLEVKNDHANPYALNFTDYFKLQMPNGKAGRYNVAASAQRQPKLSGTLNHGTSQEGWAGYLIQVVDGAYKLTVSHPDLGEATYEFTL